MQLPWNTMPTKQHWTIAKRSTLFLPYKDCWLQLTGTSAAKMLKRSVVWWGYEVYLSCNRKDDSSFLPLLARGPSSLWAELLNWHYQRLRNWHHVRNVRTHVTTITFLQLIMRGWPITCLFSQQNLLADLNIRGKCCFKATKDNGCWIGGLIKASLVGFWVATDKSWCPAWDHSKI